MFTIGSIEIHLVSDGVVWQDRGGVFGLVPRPLWEPIIQPDELDRLPMALTCLLVRAAGKTIVVDTGYGTKITPKLAELWNLQRPHGTLIDGLARLGIAPGDVDIVIDTHLHADHCAGNTVVDSDGS
ncbi:MAG: MBL fold metallo-hydrolase, partial [Anaerolineae bacterium]|nr:MBL fold metallo-hydrolase [Anaerolineae bacterium]